MVDLVNISNEYVKVLNHKIIDEINEPEELYKLKPREFEIATAEILERMGFEIFLTKETRDNGRDILAFHETPLGKYLTIVECKKFSIERKVGIETVQRLLWVSDNLDKSSKAMLVTTSHFTTGAKRIEKENQYKLSLSDFDQVSDWIKRY